MEMTTTRRLFLGGAAALAIWPQSAWCVPVKPKRNGMGRRAEGGVPPLSTLVWENPDGTATDSVMVRRLYLDLAGRIPTKDEAQTYVYSSNPSKRESLVDRLLASSDFADYWALRLCDIMRVKSEFPINLWPNAVYVYHARIRSFVAENEPWDAFGRALLTSQGSDFRDAEVNFFRATDKRNPDGWAEATAQTFLGIPPAKLPPERRAELASYFSNVKIKNTREWKEEIVFVDGPDRRGELCDRLFSECRKEVADAFLAAVRGWIFGPAAPAKESGGEMRLKDVLRGIMLSDEYARGSVTGGFPVRRLDAEVLDDAFCSLSGDTRNYQSPAPEPFTFLPKDRKTICIEDGSISNGFLTLFGKPARDTGLPEERGTDVTAKQRLYLFNSGTIHAHLRKTISPNGGQNGGQQNAGRNGGWRNGGKPQQFVYGQPVPKRAEDLYWRILSRAPTQRERQLIVGIWQSRGGGKKKGGARPFELLRDVAWCLVNSKEFIFRT